MLVAASKKKKKNLNMRDELQALKTNIQQQHPFYCVKMAGSKTDYDLGVCQVHSLIPCYKESEIYN